MHMIRSTKLTAFTAVFGLALGCSDPTQPGPADGQAGVDLVFTSVAAGHDHTCATTPEHRVLCWGGNEVGQLGAGEFFVHRGTPREVVGDLRFQSVTNGAFHSCAVTLDSIAYCWGFNDVGQLGIGTKGKTHKPVPTPVATTERFRYVDAGGGHSCGITATGDLYCWGEMHDGQPDDSTTNTSIPVRIGDIPFQDVSTGADHRCGTSSGQMFCWGAGSDGRLGNGSATSTRVPSAVDPAMAFDMLAVGGAHTCAETTIGELWCWGLNSSGQLGDGTTQDSYLPMPSILSANLVQMTAGNAHTCAVDSEGAAWCWGRNDMGQLGNGLVTVSPNSTPEPVGAGATFVQLAAGRGHTCGLTTAGRIYCWGFNQRGQLGDGTTRLSPIPLLVTGASDFTP